MEFLREICRKEAKGFKDLADEVWDTLGDTKGFPEEFKRTRHSSGKYALTAQLLMTLNFPHEASFFRDTFNIVADDSPSGAQGFSGTPIGDVLSYVAHSASIFHTQAVGVVGHDGDISATDTYDDLRNLLEELGQISEESEKKGGK